MCSSDLAPAGGAAAVGSGGANMLTKAGVVSAAAGSGGVFVTESDGAQVSASAGGAGNVQVHSTAGTLAVGGSGVSTATGNVLLDSGDTVVLNAGEAADAFERAPHRATFAANCPYQSHATLAPNCALADVRADLAKRGHTIQEWPEWTWLAGSVEAIVTDPKSGMMGAGADPRRPAYAIAI